MMNTMNFIKITQFYHKLYVNTRYSAQKINKILIILNICPAHALRIMRGALQTQGSKRHLTLADPRRHLKVQSG
jgi:hypothetical protein